ncbi:MAG: hypothetical protein ACRDGM_11835 [bacterium]
MPSMTNRQSVGVGLTVRNVFSDELNYRLKQPSRILLYGTAAAIGLLASLYIGDQNFLDDQEVSAQNRMPLIPDDFLVEAAGYPGDEIILRWRNPTAGAIVGFSRIDIIPLATGAR